MNYPQQQRQSAALSSYYNTLELNSQTHLLSKEIKIIFEGNFRTENTILKTKTLTGQIQKKNGNDRGQSTLKNGLIEIIQSAEQGEKD